jgi:hypothetical protein
MAPSVLFFALTGAAQLFNLHEAHGSYRPPEILEKLSSVHKDQVFRLGNHHESPQPESDSQKPGEVTASRAAAEDDDKAELSTRALKAFFLLVALCLVLSTALGLWMGLTQTRQKLIAWMLVLSGALIPAGLVLF